MASLVGSSLRPSILMSCLQLLFFSSFADAAAVTAPFPTDHVSGNCFFMPTYFKLLIIDLEYAKNFVVFTSVSDIKRKTVEQFLTELEKWRDDFAFSSHSASMRLVGVPEGSRKPPTSPVCDVIEMSQQPNGARQYVMHIGSQPKSSQVKVCFKKLGQDVYETFDTEYVPLLQARKRLNLKEDESFKLDATTILNKSLEARTLVDTSKCNVVFSPNAEESFQVCTEREEADTCRTIVVRNSATIQTLRDKYETALPAQYRDKRCANIVFLQKNGRKVERSEETELQFKDILADDGVTIKARNKFIHGTSKVDILWELSSHRVEVNVNATLSNLRYWLMFPNACPNLKARLGLPNGPLFPRSSDEFASNWLARDKRADLAKIPENYQSTNLLTAPYNQEDNLLLRHYTYSTNPSSSSNVERLYYVDVFEKSKPSFTGARTNEFRYVNKLALRIESRSPADKILLPLKDLRTTNGGQPMALSNVIVTTNSTSVTLCAKWTDHQRGFAYECELFDYRNNFNDKHILFYKICLNDDGICCFRYIYDNVKDTSYDLVFQKDQVIENIEDSWRYRSQLGIVMRPYAPGKYDCYAKKKSKRSSGNVDISATHVIMGGASKGQDHGDVNTHSCNLYDQDEAKRRQRQLEFLVFIFRSQDIAEKVFEDIPEF